MKVTQRDAPYKVVNFKNLITGRIYQPGITYHSNGAFYLIIDDTVDGHKKKALNLTDIYSAPIISENWVEVSSNVEILI